MTEKRMYLTRQAEPGKKYPVTTKNMMAEATRLRAIDGKTVNLHVEVGPEEKVGPGGTQPPESKARGRKKADNSLINPVDEVARTEPMSGHAESSGGPETSETDHADPGQPDG